MSSIQSNKGCRCDIINAFRPDEHLSGSMDDSRYPKPLSSPESSIGFTDKIYPENHVGRVAVAPLWENPSVQHGPPFMTYNLQRIRNRNGFLLIVGDKKFNLSAAFVEIWISSRVRSRRAASKFDIGSSNSNTCGSMARNGPGSPLLLPAGKLWNFLFWRYINPPNPDRSAPFLQGLLLAKCFFNPYCTFSSTFIWGNRA